MKVEILVLLSLIVISSCFLTPVSAHSMDDLNPSSETKIMDLAKQSVGSDSLHVFVNNKVIDLHSLSSWTNNEPSLAKNGNVIFYTGNQYAARSIDGGSTWMNVNPFSDMPDFDADQHVIYDFKHGIFIWYRQGGQDDNGENRVRLSVSKDATTWWSYDFKPTDLNPQWTKQWFDYPQLALSDNYLYFTTDMVAKGDNSDNVYRAVILRIPIDVLLNDKPMKYDLFFDCDGSNCKSDFGPVQGSTDTMYFAAKSSESEMTIYEWPESSPTIKNKFVRQIPTSNLIDTGKANCQGPDGNNWCGRSASTFTSGWKIGNIIGFFWTAGKGNGFPWPYVDASTFRISNMTYLSRPLLWSHDYAWQFGSAFPNSRGELGIIAFYGGGKINPSVAIGISNNLTDNSMHWEMYPVIYGRNGPSDSQWGDFLTVRQYDKSSPIWIASAFTLQSGTTGNSIEPRYLVFGHESDANSAGFSSTPVNIETKTFDSTISIPSWIKNNAKWWSEGSASDADFTKGIQYLIQNRIMKIPQTPTSSISTQKIPSWVKNNAGWWAAGKIGDSDFVQGIQYMIRNGIIQLATNNDSGEKSNLVNNITTKLPSEHIQTKNCNAKPSPGIDLSNCNLSNRNFNVANLTNANLSGANLSGAQLRSADLSNADLSRANLSDADLDDADLSEADLTGANLSGADTAGADLSCYGNSICIK